MSTQTPKQAAALAAMHAANAALTPEERKARSAKAAAASAARTKAQAEPAKADTPETPMPGRFWRVTLVIEHEGQRALWACDESAPTMRKAAKGARRTWASVGQGRGTAVATASVVDKHMALLPNLSA